MESEVFSMKKEYDKKKKLVILILAVVAVCLAGGLCFYLIRIGTPEEPEKEPVQQVTEQMEVTVPEIDITKESDALGENETDETEDSGQETEQLESSEQETVDIHTGSEQGRDDSGKFQTKADAQPPAALQGAAAHGGDGTAPLLGQKALHMPVGDGHRGARADDSNPNSHTSAPFFSFTPS